MLKFDPITLADWQSRHIGSISIEFIPSGCEGTSIAIHENMILPGYVTLPNSSDILTYTLPDSVLTLREAYITHTGKKWIMKSDSVLTRCGCGRSFGIATGDSKIDKIRLLKSKLAKSKGIIH
ncbi:hypothetical protein H7170_02670 [Candidatus Gracilibacteria bacterium]|nr:hypothetical protein [Candidatus Gracilibacteria bacterium]